MIVVSDASPLIGLAAVGRFGLLHDLYGEVVIPEAVRDEVAAVRPEAPGATDLSSAEWVSVRPVKDRRLVAVLAIEVDRGEAEAIALAVETGAGLLLMDERRGRAVAERMGQSVVGVLGVLVEAKARGAVAAVRPILDALATGAGFRVSEALYARVLAEVGES